MLKASIETLQDNAHNNAIAKGFWDDYPTGPKGSRVMTPDQLAAKLALIHSEVSEALEDLREDKMETRFTLKDDGGVSVFWELDVVDASEFCMSKGERFALCKPVGFPSEMADIVIRCLDLCGALGIDLQREIELKMAHNATRPAKHGKAI